METCFYLIATSHSTRCIYEARRQDFPRRVL